MPEPDAGGPVAELIARSHRLGGDRTITNYGGGNTSCKALARDPVTAGYVEVLHVKGSGGDIGTLTAAGLATLRLDRLRQLPAVFAGPDDDDAMVDALEYCLHGRGGAAPSIDTAMHGLLEFAHVDHLHPEAGIAVATAADGERITAECFGGRVLWVPWRRPGFALAQDIRDALARRPDAIGAVLAGHGITAWGATSQECEERSRRIVDGCTRYLAERGRPHPFGDPVAANARLDDRARDETLAMVLPALRGLLSTDARRVLAVFDDERVHEFLGGADHARAAELGASCPDHFLRTRVRPMLLDLPATAGAARLTDRLEELHTAYRRRYRAYYQEHADAATPAMRGADPTVVLLPGLGLVTAGADARTARITGEYYLNAIAAMRGAEAVSSYRPIDEREKFRIEYWTLEEAKLSRLPPPPVLAGRVALVTGAASGIGRAIAARLVADGASVVLADRDEAGAETAAEELGGRDHARAVALDVTDENAVVRAVRAAVLAFGGVDIVVNSAGLSLSRGLLDTTVEDWDRQHDVMARGSFLVTRECARVMIAQGDGGDVVYVASKNSIVAGPKNVAYGAAKADQAHQVRLLAAELGEHGIRVNGINPDGVVRGSGIFRDGWGADRAAAYGVAESELGAFYAGRTLLGREVLPDDVAAAVHALLAGDLALTTGLHIPVDAGVAGAFLR